MNYFYQPGISNGDKFLEEEEFRHCVRVLRHEAGDQIRVLDGKGIEYRCELIRTDTRKAQFRILETLTARKKPYTIHLGIAVTKNMDRMEWLVEKTTELGIDQITFLVCERSERRKLKMDRLNKKAVSAMKQSGNLFLPVLRPLISFDEFLRGGLPEEQRFVANAEAGAGNPLIREAGRHQAYLVVVGPEGDFSETEIKKAGKSGLRPVSLGSTRLRTETAGLVACVQLQSINAQ